MFKSNPYFIFWAKLTLGLCHWPKHRHLFPLKLALASNLMTGGCWHCHSDGDIERDKGWRRMSSIWVHLKWSLWCPWDTEEVVGDPRLEINMEVKETNRKVQLWFIYSMGPHVITKKNEAQWKGGHHVHKKVETGFGRSLRALKSQIALAQSLALPFAVTLNKLLT